MMSFNPQPRSTTEILATGLAWVGHCLIALFLLILMGSFLPPRLLDPNWQLNLTSNLVDNGAYPLIGIVLALLAEGLVPNNQKLGQRATLLRSLACWACVGYLLLAPLQGLIFSRGLNQVSVQQDRQTRNARAAISRWREAITTAPTLSELQNRLARLDAPALPGDASLIPLDKLKSSLLNQLEGNEQILNQGLQQPLVLRLWQPFQKALRNAAASLVLAVGFAAVAIPKHSSDTLLHSWLHWYPGLRQVWRDWEQKRQRTAVIRRERQELARHAADIRRAQQQSKGDAVRFWWNSWMRKRRARNHLKQIARGKRD